MPTYFSSSVLCAEASEYNDDAMQNNTTETLFIIFRWQDSHGD
jgi:hypothetical protein